MLFPERLKDILDTQTIILFHLDNIRVRADGRETAGIQGVAKTYSIDRATVRRNFKGDGKRHRYENSLVGKGLVVEVKMGARTEYMITDKGHVEVSERKSVMRKMVG